MRRWIHIFITAVCLLALVSPALSMNAVVNPGFETGALAPWYQGYPTNDTTYYVAQPGGAHSGSYCVAGLCGPSGGVGPVQLMQSDIYVPGNTDITISLWWKTSGPGWGAGCVCDPRVYEYDSNGVGLTDTRFDLYTAYQPQWTLSSYSFRTQPTTAKVAINLNTFLLNSGLDAIYFDDVDLQNPLLLCG